VDDHSIGFGWVETRDLVAERLAGTRERAAVEESSGEELLDDDRHTTDVVDVDHRIRTEGS
jgi:hypothetical protein